MAENFDGVWELRLYYTTLPVGFVAMEHVMTLDVAAQASPPVGTSFDQIQLSTRGAGDTDLETFTNALVAGLLPFYTSTSEFSRAELWQIPEGTYAGTFVSSLEIAEAGTNVGQTQVAQQNTFTFRSIDGGHARLQLMESAVSGNTRQVAPYSGITATLATFLTGLGTAMLARDNSYVFANIAFTSGQNERLFKKRFRQ